MDMDDTVDLAASPDFKAIFNAAPTPYLILASSLIIVAVNDAYLLVTRQHREDLHGRYIFDVFPDNLTNTIANGVEKLRQSLERVLAFRVRDTMAVQRYDIPVGDPAEGQFEERYWSPINTSVFNVQGALTHIIHRVENVTEAVRAETVAKSTETKLAAQIQEIQIINAHLHNSKLEARAAARRAEGERQRVIAVLDAAPVGIVVVDRHGALLQTNRTNQQLWGEPPTPLQHSVDLSRWVGRWADGSSKSGRRVAPQEWPLARALQGAEVPYDIIELDSFDSSRSRHTVLASAVPIRDAQGTIDGAVATFMDISERVNAEQALRQAIDQQTFQLALSDQIRPLTHPGDITSVASKMLAERLNVVRVTFSKIDRTGETIRFQPGWARDRMALLDEATIRLNSFGPRITEALYAGRAVSIADVFSGEQATPYTSACAANGVRAVLAIPLMKGGQLGAVLTVHHARNHLWTDEEISLLQDALDRTWSAVERADAEADLRREHAQNQAIFDSMAEGFALLNENWTILQMNAAGLRICQLPSADVVGRNHWDVWPNLKGTVTEALYRRVKQTNIAGMAEVTHTLPSGGQIWVELRAYPARSGGIAFFFRDITHRRDAEEKVRHAALHDALTGLPNRAMLFDYAERLLAHHRRTNACAAVLFLDLDRFKSINDTHGHEVGDKILKEVATRLLQLLRADDIVIRLGGDEFLIVLQEIKQAYAPVEVANHIIGKINEPYYIGELTLSLSTSVGISVFPDDGQDIDTLISHADAAMYQAKQAGRNNFQFYSATFSAGSRLRLTIEQGLKSALHGEEFHLCYQPVVDVATRRIVSVEALLRWRNSDVGPERFVPIAEASGVINRIGRWVLQEAARQHKFWLANGLPPIPIAVNVSVVEFRDRDFVNRFQRLVLDQGIAFNAIQLELTETAVMDDIEYAVTQLSELKALGVKILLDDFGTGHSSLAHLARLPLNKMKIDKSFISRLETDVASRAVTDAMLALGHTLGLDMIAEGVESANELAYLAGRGCHQVQGYFLGKPMSGEVFESWYKEHSPVAQLPGPLDR